VCFWCGGEFGELNLRKTAEHLVPRAQGGGAGLNLVAAHQSCNTDRNQSMAVIPFHIHGRRWHMVRGLKGQTVRRVRVQWWQPVEANS